MSGLDSSERESPSGQQRLPEWLRISVGTPSENARCLDALEQALTELQE